MIEHWNISVILVTVTTCCQAYVFMCLFLYPHVFQSLPEDNINEALGPWLRLSEWMPWQNRKHATRKIDHSLDTKHLVEMIEFIDVQRE